MKKAIPAFLLFLGSCKSTENINRFAKSASTGIAGIELAVPGFKTICRSYSEAALAQTIDTTLYSKSGHPVIPCVEYILADSLVLVINRTLVNYFSMLQAVSDKKLLAYDSRDLVNSLNSLRSGVNPAFSVSEEKISAVKGLLNTVLNEPIKWYRYQKLVRTMQENDASLSRVLKAYSFILDTAMAGEILQAKQNYTSFVYVPLYGRSQTPVEKALVNQQYREFQLSMENEKKKIHQSAILLVLLEKDHHMLAFGKPPVGFAYTEADISQDIVLLNKMITELLQLIR